MMPVRCLHKGFPGEDEDRPHRNQFHAAGGLGSMELAVKPAPSIRNELTIVYVDKG